MRTTRKILLLVFILVLVIPSSFKVSRVDYRDARYNNVCKNLKGDVLLYFMFIDSKFTTPWTEFDIQSTIDSIRVAINWLHLQSRKNDIPLNIKADFWRLSTSAGTSPLNSSVRTLAIPLRCFALLLGYEQLRISSNTSSWLARASCSGPGNLLNRSGVIRFTLLSVHWAERITETINS